MRTTTRGPDTSVGRNLAIAILAFAALAGMAPVGAEQYGKLGQVSWFDLVTEDGAAARTFYAGLFGWQFERSPTGSYTAVLDGVSVAGISEIDDTIPDVSEAQWLPAVVVDDLAKAVDNARELGATVHEEIQRLPTYGSWAVVGDPQGATVVLVVLERDLGSTEGPGAWVWAELWTDDLDASSRFYETVVGWDRSEVEREEQAAYPLFVWSDDPRAGLVLIDEEEPIEPAWAPYLGVTDLEASVEKARALGGEVLMEPNAEYGNGRVALLADPTGGAFFVYRLDEEVAE